jgi:hypothetical protein
MPGIGPRPPSDGPLLPDFFSVFTDRPGELFLADFRAELFLPAPARLAVF